MLPQGDMNAGLAPCLWEAEQGRWSGEGTLLWSPEGQLGRGLGPGYARHYHVLWNPASHLQGKGWRLRTVRPVVLAHQGQVQVVGGGGARWQPGIPGPPHRVLCGNPESAMDVPHPSVTVLLNSGPEAVPSATPHLGCEPC